LNDVATPKLPPPPREAPEELLVLLRAGGQEFAVCRDDVDGAHVVARQSEAPAEPAESAAEREAAHAGVRHGARGGCETVRQRLAIERA
jgi:hypothetical protein